MTTEVNTDIEIQPDAQVMSEQEYDQYLFALFISDHIENQVQRLMEDCRDQSSNL